MSAKRLVLEWLALDALARSQALNEDPSLAAAIAEHMRSLAPEEQEDEEEGEIVLPLMCIMPSSEAGVMPLRLVRIRCSEVCAIEYGRIGARGGSWVFVRVERRTMVDDDAPIGARTYDVFAAHFVALEPGAVLMRIFHESPDDASRLDACAKRE